MQGIFLCQQKNETQEGKVLKRLALCDEMCGGSDETFIFSA